MDFIATRTVTDDVEAVVSFYEKVTGVAADRIRPLFAELRNASGTLAISSSDTWSTSSHPSPTARRSARPASSRVGRRLAPFVGLCRKVEHP